MKAFRLFSLVFGLALATSLAADEAPKPAPAADDRPKVTLKWSTASEVDNYGFNIMRGDEEKGPFKAINEKILPGAGNSDTPKEYRFEDFGVVKGKTYHYYIESVSTTGVHEKFSPTLKKVCCKDPKAPEAAKTDKPGEKPAEKAPAKAPSKKG
jgi:hypothetical protein